MKLLRKGLSCFFRAGELSLPLYGHHPTKISLFQKDVPQNHSRKVQWLVSSYIGSGSISCVQSWLIEPVNMSQSWRSTTSRNLANNARLANKCGQAIRCPRILKINSFDQTWQWEIFCTWTSSMEHHLSIMRGNCLLPFWLGSRPRRPWEQLLFFQNVELLRDSEGHVFNPMPTNYPQCCH